MYTAAAFEKFACQRILQPGEGGAILARLFKRFVIRRDYAASCVVDHKGKEHVIGSSMRAVHRYTLHLDNDEAWQEVHDSLIGEHQGNVIRDETSEQTHLNGRAARCMNFAAISPLLLCAKGILQAKVDAERDSLQHPYEKARSSTRMRDNPDLVRPPLNPAREFDSDYDEEYDSDEEEGEAKGDKRRAKGKRPKIKNPHLAQYRALYEAGQYDTWFRKLMEDIYVNLETMDPDQEVMGSLFNGKRPQDMTTTQLVNIFVASSPRLKAMIHVLADQVDNRNEKALIFAQSPWEQMLYAVILRLLDYKANAVLASQKTQVKDELIARFQTPLTRWTQPDYDGVKDSDLEILVLSYHMNSGLNLHPTCHNLHAPSPPPSYSIWIQTCGRIARFSQAFDCVVIMYIGKKTYNVAQYQTLMMNALPTVAALTCKVESDRDGQEHTMASSVSFAELKHFHGYMDTLVDDRTAGFQALKDAKLIEEIDEQTKFIRILNIVMGKSIVVDESVRDTY
ncbi:hypothetical protein B5807_11600 [Epicoccum nigrum]|uniref:Uncharacterized protein n=1 Tax=Epicoccum nigrum TaxID=105696 RepID=A0A1Y2LIE3_EPING|nr:hypothetical protein B5807_11600 [Epicoccum nigrum]